MMMNVSADSLKSSRKRARKTAAIEHKLNEILPILEKLREEDNIPLGEDDNHTKIPPGLM